MRYFRTALITCLTLLSTFGISCFKPKEALKTDEVKPDKYLTLDLGQGVTMKLVRIPAGKFTMGSPQSEKDRSSDEDPQRVVTITKPFYMGVYEVTQEQYQAIMGTNPSFTKGAKNPVDAASWNTAISFCKKLSKKTGKTICLPTEAEWEYACRAGTATPFNTGKIISAKQANYDGVGKNGKTMTVGSFKPNAWGLYDMHGNVSEYCHDWYTDSYIKAGTRDPVGLKPGAGSFCVSRGGSFWCGPVSCRSATRSDTSPIGGFHGSGFRVVISDVRTEADGIWKIWLRCAYHVVYVIDRSGSMVPIFDEVCQQVRLSTSRLKEVQYFHVIFFTDGKTIENSPRKLVKASDDNKEIVAKFLNPANKKIRPWGKTTVLPAIKRAFEVLKNADTSNGKKGKLLYLLSDGDFGNPDISSRYKGLPGNKAVIQWLKDNNKKGEIHVNTLLYGSEPSAIKVMKQIAKENGGMFRHVTEKD